MTVFDLIERAKAVLQQPIVYRLGSGGMDPDSHTPAGRDGACDCSGYVAWCLGLSRMTDEPFYRRFFGADVGWINTDAMAADIRSDAGILERLDRPVPGAIIVYPGPPVRPVGHCGIILRVRDATVTSVIHCSRTNHTATGHAVQVTDAAIFEAQADTVIGAYTGLQTELEALQPALSYQDVPSVPTNSRWRRLLWRAAHHVIRRYVLCQQKTM